MSLKCSQDFRRSIHLSLLIEVRRAEAASKLETLERGKRWQWVWDKPCCKGTQLGERQGVSFSDSLLWLLWWCPWGSPSLSSTVSPLDHCYTGLWGHRSLQRRNFSISPGKCSPLLSPQLGERPWHRNTYGEPQSYFQLSVSGSWQCSTFQKKKKTQTILCEKCFSTSFFFFPKPLPTSFAQLNLIIHQCGRDELCICPTCSILPALARHLGHMDCFDLSPVGNFIVAINII